MPRLLLYLLTAVTAQAGDYFQIKVADGRTGRGVPLVELVTTNHISSYTDSNGVLAWNEPGLMDRRVWFRVSSPGYRLAGGGTTLEVKRGAREQAVCTRTARTEAWLSSPDIVPLYFDGAAYSTQAGPGAKKVARVWRNPLTSLALDGEAGPVQ